MNLIKRHVIRSAITGAAITAIGLASGWVKCPADGTATITVWTQIFKIFVVEFAFILLLNVLSDFISSWRAKKRDAELK